LSDKLIEKKRKSVNYINNQELCEHLKVYREAYFKAKEAGEELPRIPEYVGQAILLLTNRIATKRSFSSYSFLDEMISDAIENVCLYLHNYDPTKPTQSGKPNAFAYLTKVIWWAFVRRINYEKRQQYLLYKNSMNQMIEDQLNPNMILGVEQNEMYDNIQEFVRDYEVKHKISGKKKC